MSYDDGRIYDRKLIDIFNKYDITGTFHLNSGEFSEQSYVNKAEVAFFYKGHEVAVHTVNHPYLTKIPQERLIEEVMKDRRNLEEITSYPITGMSYPYGSYNKEVAELLPQLGIEYSRTTNSTYQFQLPEDFLEWSPTCHYNENVMGRAEEFLNLEEGPALFYVWGHSYEFDDCSNWKLIEKLCSYLSNREDIWYATNDLVYNRSHLSVWISKEGEPIKVPSGEIVNLKE